MYEQVKRIEASNDMIETIITNYDVSNDVYKEQKKPERLSIFEA